MKDALFGPAMTGPIDDPRAVQAAAAEITETLFDDPTRVRLQRLADGMHASPLQLIREATLRYLDANEHDDGRLSPDVPQE